MSANFRFVHVSFVKPENVTIETLIEMFNKARDWARYTQGNWILYTAVSIETWRDRIHAIPGMENQSIFICEFEASKSTGYMPKWVWEWFSKDR